jgi:GAF domain-containing protein/HAMP domain-containing protein
MIIVFVITVVASVGIAAYITNRSLSVNLTTGIINNQTALANTLASQTGQIVNSEFDKLNQLSITKTIQDRAEAASLTNSYSQDVADIEQMNQIWRVAVAANNEADPLVAGVLFDYISPELHKFQKAFPENANVLLTDKWGFNVASTSLTSNFYQADALWWRTAHSEDQYISQPIYNPATKTIAFDIAIPVYSNSTREFVGILRTTINFNILTNLLANSILGQTGYAIVYQPTDQFIKLQAKEDGNYEILQGFASRDLKAFNESSNTNMDFSLNGVNVLASLAPVKSFSTAAEGAEAVDNLHWRVIILQEKSEALQPVETQTRNILLSTFAIAIVAAFVAFGLAQTLFGPIIRLNAVAEKVTAGDLSVQAKVETNDEIGTLAVTFNNMLTRLRDLIGSLEQRVEERTAELEESSAQTQRRASQLEAIADVASSVASLQDVRELLPYITQTISERFGFYHAGIFLLSEDKEYAVLRAANSEGGQKMLSRKHQLRVGQEGIVGFAVDQKRARIALDVGEDSVFFNNPDLPATRSEMALPLIIGKDVIGVLDVQSDQPNAFSNEDIEVLSTLANQVAVAIENARLFAQSQQALRELENTFQRYISNEWRQFAKQSKVVGYRAHESGLEPITNKLKETTLKNGNDSTQKIPISLRGTTLGTLNVDMGKRPQEYTKDKKEIVQTVADRLALALESARLFEETNRRAERERLVTEITAKMRSTNDPDVMIQTTLNELKIALGATRVQLVPHTLDGTGTKSEPATPPEANPTRKSNNKKKPGEKK